MRIESYQPGDKSTTRPAAPAFTASLTTARPRYSLRTRVATFFPFVSTQPGKKSPTIPRSSEPKRARADFREETREISQGERIRFTRMTRI